MIGKYKKNKIYDFCKHCKKKFRLKSYCHSFCSSECRYLYHHPKTNIKIKCLKCGKEIMAHNSKQKYCSEKCKNIEKTRRSRKRAWVGQHYQEIWKILGKKCCNCGGEANEIHHKTYEIPIKRVYKHPRKKPANLIKFDKCLKEYCKYLEPLCSKCHRKKHTIHFLFLK